MYSSLTFPLFSLVAASGMTAAIPAIEVCAEYNKRGELISVRFVGLEFSLRKQYLNRLVVPASHKVPPLASQSY
jgi:hypothetical protein